MNKKIIFVILLIIVMISCNIVTTLAATKSELQHQQSEIGKKIDSAEE